MATLESSIQLRDNMSPVLQNLGGVLDATVNKFQQVNAASENIFNFANFGMMHNSFNLLNVQLDKIEENVQKAEEPAKKVKTSFDSWKKAVDTAKQALGAVKGTLDKLGVLDISGAFDRLDTMNQYQRTITRMSGSSDLAKASLEQLKSTVKGTAYGLDTATKSTQDLYSRGMSLGAASNQMRVWGDAVSFYGAGTSEQLGTAMDAVGKMYSSGKVEMDQLSRLYDIGINPVEIYAQAVGQSAARIEEELASGAISSAQFLNTVTQAMDASAASGAAQEGGMSWEATFNSLKETVAEGWAQVMQSIDSSLAANGMPSLMELVQSFGTAVGTVLSMVAGAMEYVVPFFIQLCDFGQAIADNWGIISPILWGVAAALFAYGIALAVNTVMEVISNVQKQIAAVAAYAKAKALLASKTAQDQEAVATANATVAQTSFNTALMASPLTWILLIIIAVIVAIYAIVGAINKVTGSTISATGVICGAFAAAGAFIWNLILAAGELILGVINNLVSPILTFVNFFGNVFNDPIGSIIHLFGDLADNVLGTLQNIASAMDFIFKKNMADTIQGWRDDISSKVDDMAKEFGNGEYEKIVNSLDLSLNKFGVKGIEYGVAWDTGYGFGENLENSLGDMFDPKQFLEEATKDLPNELDDKIIRENNGPVNNTPVNNIVADNTGATAENTARMADSMDGSTEELKWLRVIAERLAIDKATKVEVNVDMSNMQNSMTNSTDIDGFLNGLTERVEEAVLVGAQGAHQ